MNLRRTAAVSVLAVAASGCSTASGPPDPMEKLYPDPPRPEYRTLGAGDDRLAYVEMRGEPESPPIVFIHGSPGDWTAWRRYLVDPALKGFGDRIAVDRPGFGGSAGTGTVTSFAEQARRIAPLLDPAHPAYVVGHSHGGPIALRLAADYPDRVKGVLLIAAAVSPQREGLRWYNSLASVFDWMLPRSWRRSNREMARLQPELELLQPDLPKVRCPVLALQGMEDPIVDPRSAADFEVATPTLRRRVVRYPELDHFLLWTHRELVDDALVNLDTWAHAAPVIPPSGAGPSPG